MRRLLLGMSQDKLAESVGITFQQLQKYETGANRISVSRLYELSQVLGVSPTWFFEGLDRPEGNRHSGTAAKRNDSLDDEIMHRRETLKLVRAYYAIEHPDLRKQFGKTVQTFARLDAE